MKFILPLPPGINKTYGVNRKADHPMFKKQCVKNWEEIAGWELKRQSQAIKVKIHNDVNYKCPLPFKGKVEVGISWFVSKRRDIDAGLKVLLDLFERQRIYLNDSQIKRISYIEIEEDKNNPRVEVIINEL